LAGVLVIAPIYLSVLLLLKAMKSMVGIVQPISSMLPEWVPAGQLVALLLVLVICFFIGVSLRMESARSTLERMETSLFQRIPGYPLLRSLTQRMAGREKSTGWKPALIEIEEALVPAFIIEQLEDGRFTVFVPSIPTPLAGAVYILAANRVHPLNIPFTKAIRTVSNWGSGSKDMVSAMDANSGARQLAKAKSASH
jgi:uncharacterized membrane protein